MTDKKNNPFYPGNPAPKEVFVGREDEINSITRYIDICTNGRQQHVFLYGDRGIGKSSLAAYVMDIAKKDNNMVGIHIFLDGTHDVNTLVHDIVENILNEIRVEKWYKKVWNMFNVESVNIKGVNIKFKPEESDLEDITKFFPETLKEIVDNFENQKDGIFIILDDLNGLTDDPNFANWYKSFSDTVGTRYKNNFPIFIIIIGLPEKKRLLHKHNPSFMRIFHSSEIESLESDEVYNFFKNTFKSVDIEVEDEAMSIMVQYSSGMPTMMHEIGNAVFWLVNDHNTVSIPIAVQGVIQAGNEIGKKYLEPHMFNIQSETYKKILNKLGSKVLTEFTHSDLKEILNEDEMKGVPRFLARFKKLGIIEPIEGKGSYKFVNNLYPVYFLINQNEELIQDDQD